MKVLGITHNILENSAAVLLEDGKIISAIEEERFLRIKHAPRTIPQKSIDYILHNSNTTVDDIEHIAIGWKGPHEKEEINEFVRKGLLAGWITANEKKLWFESFQRERALLQYLKQKFPHAKITFVKHHIAHAASACFVSGFNKSMFFTSDGRGEFESGTLGEYKNGELEVIRSIPLNESLGSFYGNFTMLCGFKEHSEEGKTMGLAPYGISIKSLHDILQIKEGMKIEIDWERLFSLVRNKKILGKDPINDERSNFAATAQSILENCVLELISELKKITNNNKICLAGGTALNIDMNGKLLDNKIIKNIFVQPASNDAGVALGAALVVHHEYSSIQPQKIEHVYFGPEYDDKTIKKEIMQTNLKFKEMTDKGGEVAELIAKGKIIGWMQGRMEFGPRALGARSLIADPTDKKMWAKVNKIKGREYWRPLAPSIIEEKSSEFFNNHNIKSPFMLLRFMVKENKLNDIPAVVHVDDSSRVQTVSKKINYAYWDLIKNFQKISGIPVILNTSFNLRGEPIVNTPSDAIKSFKQSGMDNLCIGNFLITK